MLLKKPRRAQTPSPSTSPVVSDDDGIDEGFVQGSDLPDVEHLPDPPSDDDPDSDSASSSDGDENPVGDIPMRWYQGYDHIGYNRAGEKIVASNKPSALDLAADPHAWRKVYDEKNDKVVEISHEELKAIARLRAGRYPGTAPLGEADGVDEVIAWSGPVEQMPISSGNEPKNRFLPSRHEARLVVKLVRAIRAGKLRRPTERTDADDISHYEYDVWEDHEPKTRDEMTKSERARDIMRVPAPKPALPTHRESYNPPAEYLPSKKEAKKWKDLEPEERFSNFLPTKYTSLRHVPNYDNFVKERFERCLDLYLAVRLFKDQTKVDSDDLVPDLPHPRDLHPYPTNIVNTFPAFPSRARSLDMHPSGSWLLGGCDDGCVRLFEASTGYCAVTWDLAALLDEADGERPPVNAVAWNPTEGAFVFVAAVGKTAFVVAAAGAMGVNADETLAVLRHVGAGDAEEDDEKNAKTKKAMRALGLRWEEGSGMVLIRHGRPVRTVCWHGKGDYIGVVCREGNNGTVAIHRLSKRLSQVPFKKAALVQCVKFHPTRPFFLVGTTHRVRIYNLALQEMVKTLKPGVSWISSIDVHPSGDHVLVTSYDRRVCWFDLDLSTRPYKTIRNHDKAVRVGKFHGRLPLFADASDDGGCHVFHAKVVDDLNENAVIVPVQRIGGVSKVVDSLGVLDLAWHPRLAWLFACGADGDIHQLVDCWQGA